MMLVKLPVVIVPELKMSHFSSVAAAQKGAETVTTKGGSILDFGSFSIRLRRPDNLDFLGLAILQKKS